MLWCQCTILLLFIIHLVLHTRDVRAETLQFEAKQLKAVDASIWGVSATNGFNSIDHKTRMQQGNKVCLPTSQYQDIMQTWRTSLEHGQHFELPKHFRLTQVWPDDQHNTEIISQTCVGVYDTQIFVPNKNILLPSWLKREVGTENARINIESFDPPKGKWIDLQPHDDAFANLPAPADPVEILQTAINNHFSCLTAGDTIPVVYEEKTYLFDVKRVVSELDDPNDHDASGTQSISVLDIDLNVNMLEAKHSVVTKPLLGAAKSATTDTSSNSEIVKSQPPIVSVEFDHNDWDSLKYDATQAEHILLEWFKDNDELKRDGRPIIYNSLFVQEVRQAIEDYLRWTQQIKLNGNDLNDIEAELTDIWLQQLQRTVERTKQKDVIEVVEDNPPVLLQKKKVMDPTGFSAQQAENMLIDRFKGTLVNGREITTIGAFAIDVRTAIKKQLESSDADTVNSQQLDEIQANVRKLWIR